jgi:hypothetical protein
MRKCSPRAYVQRKEAEDKEPDTGDALSEASLARDYHRLLSLPNRAGSPSPVISLVS